MNKETNIERKKGEPTDGNTDYSRLKKMTEKEIEDNAKSDPDAPLLTDEDLSRFKHVKNEGKPNGK